MKNLNLYNIPEISSMLGYSEQEIKSAIFIGDYADDKIIRINKERINELISEIEFRNNKYKEHYNEYVLIDMEHKINDNLLPDEFLISQEKEYFVGEEYYI